MAKRVSSLGHRHTANDLTPFREGSATISGAWTFSGVTTFTTWSNHERYILIDEGAGATGIYLDSKNNAAGAGLNTPAIRWREDDGTSVAGIRGYVATDDTTNKLVLGTGWLSEKLTLGSDGIHALTGNLRTSGYLSAQGGASDLGQPGQITFMDLSGGVGRFGSYNWDTAAYQPVQVVGSTAEVESVTGDLTLDSANNVLVNGPIGLEDGITAPSTVSGRAFIYVDTSDGDLKVKFGDGTVKTIATDT